MKKLFQFIKVANQVIVFSILIFVIYDFLDTKLNPYDFTRPEPEMQIITDESQLAEIPPEKQNYRIDYGDRIGDAHIFEVRRKFVASSGIDSKTGGGAALKLSLSSSREHDQIVNALFVYGDSIVHKVFDHDVFITDLEVPSFWRAKEFDLEELRCVYSVIKDDTNNDGVLSSKDRVDLYSTNGKGEDLKIVVQDIDEFHMVHRNIETEVVITRNDEDAKTFWIYRLRDESLKEIRLKNNPNQTVERNE